jgi:hypothetical protein
LRHSTQMRTSVSVQGRNFQLEYVPLLMVNQKCHPDDPNHVAVTCVQACRRLCIRGHPCGKQCAVPCGECQFPIADVNLPCGHRKATVPWYVPRSYSVGNAYSRRLHSHSHGFTVRSVLRRSRDQSTSELRTPCTDDVLSRCRSVPL